MVLPSSEIEIFPKRFMGSGTVENLLNQITGVEGVGYIVLQGQYLPLTYKIGPRQVIPIGQSERRTVEVQGHKFELRIKVGRVIVGPKDVNMIDKMAEGIRELCNRILPFGCDVRVGKFTKEIPTLSDHKKAWLLKVPLIYDYGEGPKEEAVPHEKS